MSSSHRPVIAAAVACVVMLAAGGCRPAANPSGPIAGGSGAVAGSAAPAISTGPGAAPSTDPAGTWTRMLRSDGRARSYLLHVPRSVGSRPALVLALHGSLGTSAGQERLTGYDGEADRYGFLVAYPQGVDRSWADGRGVDPADRQGVNDVQFLVDLISDLERRDRVDPRRVYLTGMSNGAFMVQRFACDRPDLVAALAPVAGTLGVNVPCVAKPGSRALPVLEVHGTADPIVPYAGGPMTGRGGSSTIESAAASAARWRGIDGCRPAPEIGGATRGSDGTTVTVSRAVGCRDGSAVELWTVTGGGHTWPGGWQYLPRVIIGQTSNAFSATDASWTFFSAHPLR